jgi:uncharacterized glyoxalase superfamily protein PhnB
MTKAGPAATAALMGIAPQFLVDDIPAALAYYRERLGFGVDFCYQSFYAAVSRDGIAIHLKCAPKTVSGRVHRKQEEHLDAYIGVTGVAALYEELRSRGARIVRPLEQRPWACLDFYAADLDGNILCFSEAIAPSQSASGLSFPTA